ncbi:hypothetical protein [Siphonobacter sp. SORGH_AS_0500]|uniref:hypothetical protein n=1 Tax=Siphonobacter sp. SORGH_AS_0500 TaxID=1864824 RepID=UPI002861DEAB|nr:hypothetical protein [Siphonobacter sp. SORGH_AS_0500]MDR6195209.1 hypothetical protein [Siphonobacter sp. SORGH_AS_0500]
MRGKTRDKPDKSAVKAGLSGFLRLGPLLNFGYKKLVLLTHRSHPSFGYACR